jgi:crotonobetainyl-CoA:carnitine CoA-transferase CaiB-like acyl-CoA transferase
MEEAMAHPHMAERQAFSSVPHPARGEVRVTSAPFHVDGSPVPAPGPAPYRAGEDTRAILSGMLGYSGERIDALLRAGAVAAP